MNKALTYFATVLVLTIGLLIPNCLAVNRALSLDGDGDHVIKNPINNFPTTEITAEFWMKSSDKSKKGTAISYASTASHNDFLIYNYQNFTPHIANQNPGGTEVSATDGSWHHIAVT